MLRWKSLDRLFDITGMRLGILSAISILLSSVAKLLVIQDNNCDLAVDQFYRQVQFVVQTGYAIYLIRTNKLLGKC